MMVSAAALLVLLATPRADATPAAPRVIHVSLGVASGGDGSLQKPLRSLEKALLDALPGDTIKVTSGSTTLTSSALPLRIRAPRITLMGAYDAAFEARDVWGTPTVLLAPWDYAVPLLEVMPGADDVVLDGLLFDAGPGNSYARGMGPTQLARQFALVRIHQATEVTVRNCAFFNATAHAVSASVRTRVTLQHNLVVGARLSAFTAWGIQEGAALRVLENTVVDTWAEKPTGGAGHALDIQPHVTVVAERNLFSGAQGVCVRMAMGAPTATLRGNVMGGCNGGVLSAYTSASAPTLYGLDGLAAASAVVSEGNRPLAVDRLPASPLTALVAAQQARPDAGAPPQLPPHAARVEPTPLPFVNLDAQAGIQSAPR